MLVFRRAVSIRCSSGVTGKFRREMTSCTISSWSCVKSAVRPVVV